jgi:hypothetical protein
VQKQNPIDSYQMSTYECTQSSPGGSPFEITSDGAGVIGFNGGYGGHLHFLEPVFEKK